MLLFLAFPVATAAAELSLSWQADPTSEAGFSIERSEGASGPFAEVATTSADTTAFTDTSVAEGVLYCYRVRAFTSSGYSEYSNVACGVSQPVVALATEIQGTGAGSIISSPSGLVCQATCSGNYSVGTAVTLLAIPAPGSAFAGWTGGACSGGASACRFAVTGATAITANFAELPVAPGVVQAPDPSDAALLAAVLPGVRSVQVGSTAVALVAVLNRGTETISGVGMSLETAIPALFSYQATDPGTNEPVGPENTPRDIAPQELQTYLVSVTPTEPFDLTNVALGIRGREAAASKVSEVDTLLLVASAVAAPDIVAVATTVTANGVIELPGADGAGAFAVATMNLGAGADITASVDTGGSTLPLAVAVCQTEPSTGRCTSAAASGVTTRIDPGATPTFAVFVQAAGPVPFAPERSRVFVRFTDAAGGLRGATSVAVRTAE